MGTGYYCQIYRAAMSGDCTNKGVSARYSRAMLYRKGEVPEELPPNVACLVIEDSPKVGPEPYVRAVPVGERRWVMFGGNFIWSSDSRFRQEVSERPIPIHDRVES